MGRKRKKRQWRKSESTEQINAALREASKVSTVNAKADDELFYVDDKTTRAKSTSDVKAVPKPKKKNNNKRRKRTPPSRDTQKKKTKSTHTQAIQDEELFDLWGAAPTKVEKRNAKRSKDESTAVVPAVELSAGSSYKPDEELRKQAVAAAAADVMDQEAKFAATRSMLQDDKDRMAGPLTSFDGDGTVAESSEEGSDNASDDDTVLPEGIYKLPRSKRSKLTVAQRNKLKRRRHEHGLKLQQQKDKTFVNQLNRIKAIKKNMVRDEKEQKSQNERMKELQRKTKADPSNVVAKRGGKAFVMRMKEPAVVMDDETGGSMRQMPVKGSLARDRMHNLLRRNKFQMGKKGAKQSQRKGRKKAVGPERWGVQALVRSQQKHNKGMTRKRR